MHWPRLMDQVATTGRHDPGRVQLLMKDDGDTYFRLYMSQRGTLVNMLPPPPDGGYDRPW
jgi:hypothetical protein